jgi:hypothetical protein
MSKLVPMIKSNVTRGLYVHMRTRKLYNVIGTGRLTNKPEQQVIIYEQLYTSLWIRDLDEFNKKFERLK